MYEIPARSTAGLMVVEETRSFWRNSCLSATLSNINLKKAILISKPDPQVQRLVAWNLNHGTTSVFSIWATQVFFDLDTKDGGSRIVGNSSPVDMGSYPRRHEAPVV